MRAPAPLFPIAATLSWGAMFPIAAHALPHVDAFNITAIRYVAASIAFIVILLIVEGSGALRTEGRTAELFWLGSLGFAGFNLLAYLGLAFTEPQNAAVIVPLMPLVTVLARWKRDGVRPSSLTLVAIVVALIGVLLVVTGGHPSRLRGSGGDLLIVLAVIGWVRYTMGAASFPHWSPLRYTTVTAALGTLTIIVATLIADAVGWQTLPAMADVAGVWREIAFLVIFGAVVAVLAWNHSVRLMGAANTSLFIMLVPVTTFVIQVARGYQPGLAELVGAGFVVLSLIVANVAGRSGVTTDASSLVPAGTRG
jgi:drug/metabolite transporter (DMT)-like permease